MPSSPSRPPPHPLTALRVLALALSLLAPAVHADAPGDAGDESLQVVTVVGVTPYGTADLSASELATTAQSAGSEQLRRSHAADLTSFLNRQMAGVTLNERQGNPLQPDLSYRGYTASPLLGTPQGLSVYVDGLRLNQPFGDVVSWDLIPRAAIQRIELVSGSSPLFGGNSLGGALSIRTKDGYSAPGTVLELSYGSYGRQRIEAETGGHSANGVYWYVTANRFRESGWRDDSPSEAQQLFAKLGWRGDRSDVALSVASATSDLNGNGLQDQTLLARRYSSVYTKPDNTRNRSALVNLVVQHEPVEGVRVSGNAWYRNISTATYNGDINGDALGQSLYQPSPAELAALAAAGYGGFPGHGETQGNTAFPRWRCLANALLNSQPNQQCDGIINRSDLSQHNAGAALQLLLQQVLLGHANTLVVGTVHDSSSEHFTQSAQFGFVAPDHGVTGVADPQGGPLFADGSQGSPDAFDARVDLGGTTSTHSVFIADSIAATERLRVNIAARYDHSNVDNRDALNPGGGPGSLDANQRFARVNPSVGLVMQAQASLTLYASYGESTRAPSSVEMGCADPANPCRLPNAMAGDPPLSQVLTRSWEAGARGKGPLGVAWTAALFRADNIDDILFVADNQAGFGYFRNFGKTRRQGVELGASGRAGAVTLAVHYTLLDATYRTSEVVSGSGNSSNDAPAPGLDGNITIQPGDRIPLLPRQLLKASAQWDIAERWSVDLDLLVSAGSYASGNENNRHQPDGVYYLGPGSTTGYGVLNLGSEWKASDALTLFLQVGNLLDRRYATAAQLGATAFRSDGSFVARPFAGTVINGEHPLLHTTFLAPGAPRSLLLGLRLKLDP